MKINTNTLFNQKRNYDQKNLIILSSKRMRFNILKTQKYGLQAFIKEKQ